MEFHDLFAYVLGYAAMTIGLVVIISLTLYMLFRWTKVARPLIAYVWWRRKIGDIRIQQYNGKDWIDLDPETA